MTRGSRSCVPEIRRTVTERPAGTLLHVVGWTPKDESVRGEVWDRISYWWKLEPGRAVRYDTAIVLNPDNVVVCVAEIRGVVKRRDIMRMGFLGQVAGDAYRTRYGRVLDRNDSKSNRLLRRTRHPHTRRGHGRHRETQQVGNTGVLGKTLGVNRRFRLVGSNTARSIRRGGLPLTCE
ncbi:hypothetical protein [Bifidobacterium moukalabense]|uniref:hypothetical protein n=1 Tax=Bifidobacterium moukalabense TaxID=1333651 RepID=UPI0010F7C1DF|nr:hypothetical protein [Bifidobacterium moukalabense]